MVLSLTSCTSKPEIKALTLDDVITLSGKGLSLSWEDFKGFVHEDVGSGRYIWKFLLDEPEHYALTIDGNSLNEPPANILLFNEAGDSIEIRTEDIEAFLAGKQNEASEPEPVPEPDRLAPASSSAPPVSSSTSPSPAASSTSSGAQSQSAQPAYSIVAEPAICDISAASVTVKITNTSQVQGGYDYSHRIERKKDGNWEPLALDITWNDSWVDLPAGQTNTEKFSLHQGQYDYQPGSYRIVFLHSLSGASAEFNLSGNVEPTYSVTADPKSYPATADSITVKITNTSQAEGGYDYSHRIERKKDGKWEPLALDITWNDSWVDLPAGQTNTETFSLYQEQYDYKSGSYRIVFLHSFGGVSVEFTLT